ncbi:MAG TPA: hypothetical protein VNO79_14270 [Actinomycetota bacterium]|nr:hypothetical protein [Actinomycetota bacterium]
MPSLGPAASRRVWRELRRVGVPTFVRWGREDARTPPPSPVVPTDLREERLPAVMASLARHVVALRRVEVRLLGDLVRLRRLGSIRA